MRVARRKRGRRIRRPRCCQLPKLSSVVDTGASHAHRANLRLHSLPHMLDRLRLQKKSARLRDARLKLPYSVFRQHGPSIPQAEPGSAAPAPPAPSPGQHSHASVRSNGNRPCGHSWSGELAERARFDRAAPATLRHCGGVAGSEGPSRGPRLVTGSPLGDSSPHRNARGHQSRALCGRPREDRRGARGSR